MTSVDGNRLTYDTGYPPDRGVTRTFHDLRPDDERGAIHASHIGSGCIAGADVAGHGAALDSLPEIRERAVTSPAIGNAAHLLIDLAVQVPGTANAVEAGAGSIGFAAVIRRRQLPLQTLERKGGLDGLLTIRGPNRGDALEFFFGLVCARRSGGSHARSSQVNEGGIAQRTESNADNIHSILFRAQEIDFSIAGNGDDRRVRLGAA